MERFIVKYNNGKIRHQRGLNATFYNMIGIGVISWAIDTQEGEIIFGVKDEHVHTEKIPIYSSTDLVVPKDK